MEFNRTKELKELCAAIGNGRIKVVAGLRQIGKSYLLKNILSRELIKNYNVKDEYICTIDLLVDYPNIRTSKKLENLINKVYKNNKFKYLFVDEVQLAEDGYAEVLIRFHLKNPDVEIFVTGSNSHALSNDIICQFKEYCSSIVVNPLCYNEIIETISDFSVDDYIHYGGIPRVLEKTTVEDREYELRYLFNEIYFKDLVQRNKFNYLSEQSMQMILSHIFSSTNEICSIKIAKRISKKSGTNTENFLKLNKEVGDFIKWCNNAYLLIPFHNAIGTAIKASNGVEGLHEKEYSIDNGLMNLNADALHLEENLLENIVFLELRQFNINIFGKTIIKTDNPSGESNNGEIDFSFIYNEVEYNIQVAHTVTDSNREREIDNLLKTPKESKKLLICKENLLEDIDKSIYVYDIEYFIKNIREIIK